MKEDSSFSDFPSFLLEGHIHLDLYYTDMIKNLFPLFISLDHLSRLYFRSPKNA